MGHVRRWHFIARERRIARRPQDFLRQRRTPHRLITDVRLVRARTRRIVLGDGSTTACFCSDEGVDSRPNCRRKPDRAITSTLGTSAIRSVAGSQSSRLGHTPRHSHGIEGDRTSPLHRHHDVTRKPARRDGAHHAQGANRLRAIHLQPR